MRYSICLFLLLISFLNNYSQELDSGYYAGQKLPFTNCFLKFSGNNSEVDYFYYKGGKFFAHFGPISLYSVNSKNKNLVLKSANDSIKVYRKNNAFIIKKKGFENIRLEKKDLSEDYVKEHRNEVMILRFKGKLYDQVKNKPDFNADVFWQKIHSYKIDNVNSLNPNELKIRLQEIEQDFLRSW